MRKNYNLRFKYNTKNHECEFKLPSHNMNQWELNNMLSLFTQEWARLYAQAEERTANMARQVTELFKEHLDSDWHVGARLKEEE